MKHFILILGILGLVVGCGNDPREEGRPIPHPPASPPPVDSVKLGEQLLELITEAAKEEKTEEDINLKRIKQLINKGAYLEVADLKYSSTPLLWASNHGYFETVQLLVEAGADLNRRSFEGATALFYADYKGHDEIHEYLKSVNAPCDVGWASFTLKPVCWL